MKRVPEASLAGSTTGANLSANVNTFSSVVPADGVAGEVVADAWYDPVSEAEFWANAGEFSPVEAGSVVASAA